MQYRKYLFYQAISHTKSFRREMKRGNLNTEIIEWKRKALYGLYAEAMNELENWTGQYQSQELKV